MTPVNVAFYHQTIGWSLRFICVEERLPKCRCCSNDWVSFNGWGTDWKKKQIYVILKMGRPGLFYLIFFFPGLNFIEKNCRLKQDSTLIVGVEGEHADHLTTTTAPKKCCQAACKHVLVKQSRFNKHKLQHKFPLLCFEPSDWLKMFEQPIRMSKMIYAESSFYGIQCDHMATLYFQYVSIYPRQWQFAQ